MKVRPLLLGYAAAAPVAAIAASTVDWRIGVGVLASSHLPMVYATLRPTSQWWGRVVTQFEPHEPAVWITIDDGPDPIDTPLILDLLRASSARATFFVKGTLVDRYPALAARIVEEGHEIGNHSHSHPSGSFWCLPRGRIADEIDRCSTAVERATGARPTRFRPPVGMKNFFVHPLLRERNLELIAWNSRAFDGVGEVDPSNVVRNVLREMRSGSIVLLHEGRMGRDGSRPNVEALRMLLDELSRRGLRAVVPASAQLLPRVNE